MSDRCLRCRSQTNREIDDGANPAFLLCPYCQQALDGKVTVIVGPVPKASTRHPKSKRVNPGRTNSFWKKRHEVIGR